MVNKKIFTLLSVLILSISVYSQYTPNLYSAVNEARMRQWVDSVFEGLSDDERIGQLFMIIAEPSMESFNMNKLIKLVNEQKIGGILFQKGDPDGQVRVTNRLQREARTPLFVALDGEWGLSMRLSNTTRFPKNMMLGAIADLDMIEQYGEEVGRQCREMGIHINFAPTIDVNSNPRNPVIGIRSFGEDPEAVANRAVAYARGLESAGVMAVAKHFPGHGDTNNDSHHALPTIQHDKTRLNEVELYPFNRFIRSGFAGMMVAHLNIPALGTNGRPSSLSREVVTGLLRDRLGFRGLCFTDGLAMKGVEAGNNQSIAVSALKAGNDILLGPVNPEKEIEAVKQAVRRKELNMADLNRSCLRILCYKYIAGLNRFRPLSTTNLDERLNTPHAAWLNAKLNAEAITVVKNNDLILPLKQLNTKRIAAVAIGGDPDNDFHTTLNKYDAVDCYTLDVKAGDLERKRLFDRLNNYDVILCSIHQSQAREIPELLNLANTKELIYVFFTVPYQCAYFRTSAANAQAMLVAYEPTPLAEQYAAQALFGGIPAKGALPVSIPNMYPAGTGLRTEKTRLGFHEPGEVNINPYKLLAIDTIVWEGLDGRAYPGCQVLVAKDGMVIYNKSFGYYDYTQNKEVTQNTVYDLASVSKVTGTLLAVLKSYDDGHFLLSDPLSDYIPELQGGDKKDIIIKDLLYHQSGLPATINFFEMAIDKDSYNGSLYSGRKDSNHPLQYDARTYVNTDFRYDPALISKSKKVGFDLEAANNFYINNSFADSIIPCIERARMGTTGRYLYSCVNFILLKIMVERQMNVRMDRFLNAYYYRRLGATTMTYNPLQKMDAEIITPSENEQFIRRQVLRGYVHDEAAAFQGGVSGNAGLFASATDLSKVLQLYLNDGIYGGERYISTKTCTLFTGSKAPHSRRGLGFDKPDVSNSNLSPCGTLAPASVYGHTGYTGTCFWIDPENQLVFIFLSNRTFPSRTNTKLFTLNIRTRIQDAIYRALTITN